MSLNLNYLSELKTLIKSGDSVEEFKKLYKRYFDIEPSENMIANFLANSTQVDSYNNNGSYDEYSSYSY